MEWLEKKEEKHFQSDWRSCLWSGHCRWASFSSMITLMISKKLTNQASGSSNIHWCHKHPSSNEDYGLDLRTAAVKGGLWQWRTASHARRRSTVHDSSWLDHHQLSCYWASECISYYFPIFCSQAIQKSSTWKIVWQWMTHFWPLEVVHSCPGTGGGEFFLSSFEIGTNIRENRLLFVMVCTSCSCFFISFLYIFLRFHGQF